MVEVSAGIIISKGRILCTQKGIAKYDYLSHKFEFPGGKLEKGETPKDAIIRELSEELSTDISKSKITMLNTVEHTYPDFTVTLHNFIIESDAFEFRLTEHESSLWVEPDQLRDIDWAEADWKVIPALEEYLAE